jgi:hypothetical protein
LVTQAKEMVKVRVQATVSLVERVMGKVSAGANLGRVMAMRQYQSSVAVGWARHQATTAGCYQGSEQALSRMESERVTVPRAVGLARAGDYALGRLLAA